MRNAAGALSDGPATTPPAELPAGGAVVSVAFESVEEGLAGGWSTEVATPTWVVVVVASGTVVVVAPQATPPRATATIQSVTRRATTGTAQRGLFDTAIMARSIAWAPSASGAYRTAASSPAA